MVRLLTIPSLSNTNGRKLVCRCVCGVYGNGQITDADLFSCLGVCVRLSGLWGIKGHSRVLLEALSIFRKVTRAVRSTGATDPVAPLLVYRHPRRVTLAPDAAHTNVSPQRASLKQPCWSYSHTTLLR